jgi:hypothetical protein
MIIKAIILAKLNFVSTFFIVEPSIKTVMRVSLLGDHKRQIYRDKLIVLALSILNWIVSPRR